DRLDRRLIDESQFRLHNQTLMEQKEKSARRLEEIEVRLSTGEHVEINLAQVQEILHSTSQAWENLQFEEKRELMRLLLEKVAIHHDRVELHLYHLPVESLETRRSGRAYRSSRTSKKDNASHSRLAPPIIARTRPTGFRPSDCRG